MTSDYLHGVISLIAVMACLWVLFIFLKKMHPHANAKNPLVKILQVSPVGVKEKLMLIEVNKTQLLIGVTPSHIGTLHVFHHSPALAASENIEAKDRDSFLNKINLARANLAENHHENK